MINTYIDIGNTNNKIYQNEKLIAVIKSKSEDALKNINWQIFEKTTIYYSSVISEKKEYLIHALIKLGYKPIALNHKNTTLKCLPGYETTGIDMKLISIGAINKYSDDLIIFTFGTATTVQVIKNKVLQTVLIMPGINNSLNALVKSADLIKKMHFSEQVTLQPKNLEDVINSGITQMYYGMIHETIKNCEKKFVFKPKIIIVGKFGASLGYINAPELIAVGAKHTINNL